jgi:hypothetical protein
MKVEWMGGYNVQEKLWKGMETRTLLCKGDYVNKRQRNICLLLS